MAIVYLNDEWIDSAQAKISVFDRGFLLGDGVFETARLHHGRYFRLEKHLSRLAHSAEQLRLVCPPLHELTAIANGLAERNDLSEASLRITITRGPGTGGLGRRGAGPLTILGTLSSVRPIWEPGTPGGWAIHVSPIRRPATNSVPAQLKALGRVYALLAHFDAEDNGFDDAVLLSADGFVAEGPTWNIFWRSANTIYTPSSAAGILEGVTRSIIIALARDAGYEVAEGTWGEDALLGSEEAFATMTSSGIVPITRIDGSRLPPPAAAPKLQAAYWDLVRRELGQTE